MLSSPFRTARTVRSLQYSSILSNSFRSLPPNVKDSKSLLDVKDVPVSRGPPSPHSEPDLGALPAAELDTHSVAESARMKLTDLGYDTASFWEQSIAWGFHDAFQHVNNVHYFRFFESGRIQWIVSIGNEMGGPAKAKAFLQAKGVGFILKYMDVKFRRPVTYPDTLLIAHKPSVSSSRTEFKLQAAAYSYAQSAIVAESNSITVWYDYDTLKKCDPGDEAWAVLKGRIKE